MTLIHKSISPFGDWIIFMNGVPIYKKWPTGRSLVFEKYGINTDNRDRDNGHYGGTPQRQKETSAVEANPYRQRAPEILTSMVSSLLEDVCSSSENVAVAARLFTVAADALYWKADEGLAEFDFAELRDHFNLKTLIDLNDPSKFPTMPVEVRSPIREYLHSIPGFRPEMAYKQTQTTFDIHAQAEMDLTKLLGKMYDTYSYLFDLPKPLRVAEKVYDTVGGFSPIWLTYLNDGKAADAEVAASETVRVPPEGYEGLPEDIVEIATALGDNPEIAHVLNAERQHWQAEIERLRKAADYISPYLRYTVGEESPGHHPTMPSAVAAFHVAFDIDTQEKRVARIRAALKRSQD